MEELNSNAEDFPNDISSLREEIRSLRQREQQLLKYKQQSEIEFGQRRAKFKELYLAREEELVKERAKFKASEQEAKKLKNELHQVIADADGYKAAAALSEKSQKEELDSLHNKYQEEIVSLQHIMSEAVREAKENAAEQCDLEKHNLMAKNQRLENEVKNLKSLLSSDGEGISSRPRMLSGLSDAVVSAIRRNTATSQTSLHEVDQTANDAARSLEESMEKAQEDAKAWRAIVMPLEEELSLFKAKLKDAQEKLHIAEAKIKEEEAKSLERKFEGEESFSREKFDEMQEKIKELNQYLEAERSSRTDLEMYVAVLNTQRGILQEDSDKLRNELHNVCRLLEQEKMAHNDLKHTWEMANVQFLENLRVQSEAFTRVWNILTPEQRTTAQQQQQERQKQQQQEAQVGYLIDLQSPTDKIPQPVNPQVQQQPTQVSMWDSIQTVPCTNQLASETAAAHSISSPDDDKDTTGLRRSRSTSDITMDVETSGGEVSRTRSVEELQMSSPSSPQSDSHVTSSIKTSNKNTNSKVDWKGFQEAVKVSHELSRSCAMCMNYERQLQKMQEENQKFQNLASNLQVELDREKKELFKEQKMRSKVEESVARAAEDAQTQINTQVATNAKLERLLTGLRQHFEATKQEAHSHITKLVKSRDHLTEELNQLRTDYTALQDNAIQQLTQMDSDARLNEMREQLMQIRAASESTEEKLRSEVTFLKDRVIAEQVAKDSLEAMLQGDVDNIRIELEKVKEELKKDRRAKEQAESQLRMSGQLLKNTEDKSKQVIIALRGQLDEANDEKSKAEDESRQLRNQLQSMTEQLNQSETVQRDFVRLSQSLQMQIAQIHESETDVRWQYPEEIKECHNCHKALKSGKDKHHCHHCGKVFCEPCTSKSALGSSSKRPHPVCDKCHAILNKDSKSTFYNTNLADDNR